MDELVLERIKENAKFFNKKELDFIYNNYKIFSKIYTLAIVDILNS